MSSQVESTSVVILGGGLTGLSAAWHLADQDYLLLEKENTLGGLARTDDYDGFRFDYGSHVWFTKEPLVKALVDNLPSLTMHNQQRSAWVHIYEIRIPAPFQANLYGLPKDIVSECIIGYIEAIQKSDEVRRSFADWLKASFGSGIYKHFMQPYNIKVWTVPPKELAADWTGARIDVPDVRQIINGALGVKVNSIGANADFGYPADGGTETIAKTIYNECSNIQTGVQICGIDLDSKTVHLADNRSVSYQSMISTIPLPELISLVENAPSFVTRAATQLKRTKLLLVNFALKRKPDHCYHWIYFAEPKYPFFRISFLHNYSESMCPGGCGSIQAECAFPCGAEINEAEIAEYAKERLSEAGYLDIQQLLFIRTRVVNPAYVICDHSRSANVQLILSYLHGQDVYCAGRFGAWEYINMDQCILAGKNAATLVSV